MPAVALVPPAPVLVSVVVVWLPEVVLPLAVAPPAVVVTELLPVDATLLPLEEVPVVDVAPN